MARITADGLALQQQGMVLVAVMMVLVMLLLMGISGARMAIQGERSARGVRDRDVALMAAEDALADAERELAGGGDPVRTTLLAEDEGYAEGCGDGTVQPDLGLCVAHDGGDGRPPAWQAVDLAGDGPAARSVPFGMYTGAEMETGEGFLPFRKPRYVIEKLPLPPGAAAGGGHEYRVTAIGFGAREGVEAVLQATLRTAPTPGATGLGGPGTETPSPAAAGAATVADSGMPASSPAASGMRSPAAGPGTVAASSASPDAGSAPPAIPRVRRTAWREVANWRELHRAAKF